MPKPPLCSPLPLPAIRHQPSLPTPPPSLPHHFTEGEDTVGVATVQGVKRSQAIPTTSSTSSSAPTITVEVATPSLSRTTQWRQRKRAAGTTSEGSPSSAIGARPPKTTRKDYCCRSCGKAMSSPDHSQFRGQRYCPSLFPDVTKEEWLVQKRAETKTKASPKDQPTQDN